MKVLVTGAAGYIGSVTTEVLLQVGHEVIALDNLELGHREAIHEDAVFVQADLRDREALWVVFAVHRPEAVMRFAAYALVTESMGNATVYFSNNVGGSCNLFAAMLAHGCHRLVYSSSCTDYGQPEEVPATADVPCSPLNPYGASKLMVEAMAAEWHVRQSGLRAAILRYFNPAGATERFGEARVQETHLIPLTLAVIVFGDDYPTPDGTCIRDYLHVVDLAEAHVCALEALSEHTLLTLNLGSGKGTPVLEVIEAVGRVTGQSVPTVIAPRRASGADSAAIYANPARACALLSWQARRDLDDIIRSAWLWQLRHPREYGMTVQVSV